MPKNLANQFKEMKHNFVYDNSNVQNVKEVSSAYAQFHNEKCHIITCKRSFYSLLSYLTMINKSDSRNNTK